MVSRVRYKLRGRHVHARVFTGQRPGGTFVLSGNLVFREDEWDAVLDTLFLNAEKINDDTGLVIPAGPEVGEIADLTVDCDERGFTLHAVDEFDAEFVARVTTVEAARAANVALAPLRDWVAEHDYQLAAYTAATPEERDAVLGRAEEVADPWEAARVKADIDRKINRGE